MNNISEARFQQLIILGKKNGLPSFTREQILGWQAARRTRKAAGGPFTVLATGTDGCAGHIMAAVMPLLKEITSGKINFVEEPIGWEAVRQAGLIDPRQDLSARFPEKTWKAAMASDAILLGAVGAEWDSPAKGLSSRDRPQWALMQLRSGFDLFANVRPANFFPSLRHLSPLKPEILAQVRQITVVRELTGGLYFGEPRGWVQADGSFDTKRETNEAVDATRYTEESITRVVRVAFDLARTQQTSLTSFDKDNVLTTSKLWRRVFERIAAEYPDVPSASRYIDDGLAQLVAKPSQFGVIVTANLFGDITGDVLGALAVGSIGMIPSGGYGDGAWPNYFEPVHGSAPRRFPTSGELKDSVVNPLATILSAEMMLSSLGLDAFALALRQAVEKTLNEGFRTYDIYRGQTDERKVGTLEMTKAVGENANRILARGGRE